ncbi:MAG: STT3 domain-containing protein [Candidatus Omnitrophota bacterium]
MKSLKTWFWLWVLAVGICCYIRLYPLRAHIWDPTYDPATLMVIYNIKRSLLEQIHAQNPQIPVNVAQHMAQEKLNETLHKNPTKIQEAIEKANQQLFKDSHKEANIYLLESDPFYFYYLTQNIVNTGRMAQNVRGSKYLDSLMTAPYGFWQPLTYHPYVGFWLYKFMKLFNPNIPLMAAVAFTPIVLIVFVLAAFFWACKTLEISAPASFVASLFYMLAPVILKRSSLGWYRTDPYNLLFTILLIPIVLKAVTNTEFKKAWKYLFLFTLTITGFAAIWQGWGFMLIISLCMIATCFAYSFFTKDIASIKYYIFLSIGIVVATILGISLLFGFNEFFILLKEAMGEFLKFTVKKFSLWPNLFMEVGELKKSSPQDFLIDCGGLLFLLSGISGFFYSVWQIFKKRQKEYTLRILSLSIFFIICACMTAAAQRFSIFALIGLALFLGLGLEAFFKWLTTFKVPYLRNISIVILTLFVVINAGKNIRSALTPIFNSAWENALVDIKNKTPEDSIVNTWWPPGHFIKGIAHRKVMFDGATLSQSATGYWMANILLSNDENQAAGLLRMLNLSGNEAVNFLTSKGLKTSMAVAVLSTIASKTNEEAGSLLYALLNNKNDVKTLMTIIRGGSPHSYVLLYNELVEKNLGLTFMGRWNIPQVEAINANPKLLSSVPSSNSAAYIDFLWNLAGGQSHYSPPFEILKQDDNALYFSENLVIDKSTMKATILSATYGKGAPMSIVYLNGGKIFEKVNTTATLRYSIVLYTQDGQMMARLMDRSLANSLLIKLFFFNGAGLEHFKPLSASSDLTGRTQIKVFEVQWN